MITYRGGLRRKENEKWKGKRKEEAKQNGHPGGLREWVN